MRIPVMLKDGTALKVYPRVLNHLLESEEVLLFKRTDGWVVLGQDPVRGAGGAYAGPERRSLVGRRRH